MIRRKAPLLLFFAAVGCSDDGTSRKEVVVHNLQNSGHGFMREISRQTGREDGAGSSMGEPERPPNDGGMIIPDPGGECPYLEYREEHTVVVDAEGNIVSETFTFCTRCLDADGNTIGEEVCVEEPILPPDVYCYEYTDGMNYCYECVDSAGNVVDSACYPIEEPPPPPDDCFARLCELDPFCCEVGWDDICEEELALLCGGGEPPPTPDPGCCEAQVCEIDPYCCEVAWDCRCDALAADLCNGGGGGDPGDPPPEPPPDDCVLRFCEAAPECCESTWSTDCEALYNEICGAPDDPGEPRVP